MNPYRADSNIFSRFSSHVVFGLKPNIGAHQRNLCERMGDAGLWIVEELPGKIWNCMKDPRVVTIALTALALLVVSFAFYAAPTVAVLKACASVLPSVPFWAVKFACYLTTVEVIIAASLRAQGRFWNTTLMNRFYGQGAPVVAVVV